MAVPCRLREAGWTQGGDLVSATAPQGEYPATLFTREDSAHSLPARWCPQVRSLPFKEGVKRQERINARVRYIEGDMTPIEYKQWVTQFESEPEPLSTSEKAEFMKTLDGVTLASDAFFPFRDSIDVASSRGVAYVVAAGGSKADAEVIAAADEYSMTMAFSGLRLFHH